MNYIIHKGDLDAQIETCLAASDPSEDRHIFKLATEPFMPCGPDCAVCAQFQVTNHMEAMEAAGRAFAKTWREKRYREEYERLSAEHSKRWWTNRWAEYLDSVYPGFDPGVGESESVLPPEELAKYTSHDFDTLPAEPEQSRLTLADIIQIKAELELNNANNQIENLRELLTNALAELERVCPLIDAAYALEKAHIYPYCFADNKTLLEFRTALAKYKSVDASAAKS